jgi:hypothetical protein
MSNYKTLDWLRLRNEPTTKGLIISVMPPDTVVEKIDNGSSADWFKIKVRLNSKPTEGFAFAEFLEETTVEPNGPDDARVIPEAHLITTRTIERASINGRAYPLNEPGFKRRPLAGLPVNERAAAIHAQLDFLNVENSIRYLPTNKNTFCNIYATDLAYSLGVYIPRVWWTEGALSKIEQGQKVDVVYEKTVTELNANSLANWFENFGTSFGWHRKLSVDELQTEVNKGTLGIIVAQRINLNRSGHIVAVVPEKDDKIAKRNGSLVVSPLQSQAGANNKKYFTGSNWWERAGTFRKFSFWAWQENE